MTASQKIKKACHFERQREIFLLHYWVLNVINLKAGQCLSVARRAGSYGSHAAHESEMSNTHDLVVKLMTLTGYYEDFSLWSK